MLRSLCPTLSFELLDAGLLALQGPASEEVLRSIQPDASGLRFMEARTFAIDGADCLVVRSGYTGEGGFEISVPAQALEAVARKLLSNPAVRMVGLGARDTLRLEAGLPLYGQDLDSTTTINQASLHWAVAKARRANGAKEGDFPGADVFLKESANGSDKRMVGLIGKEAVPIRHGAILRDSANVEIGVVTSGTVSPSTKRCVMLGYVASKCGSADQIFADVRGVPRSVSITKLPFVPKRYKR